MKKYASLLYCAAGLFGLAYGYATFVHHYIWSGFLLMAFFVALALAFRGSALLRGFSFTILIFAVVSLALYYPQYFVRVGDFKLSKLILPCCRSLCSAWERNSA